MAPRSLTRWARSNNREHSRTENVCLSQWHPYRPIHRQHWNERPCDSDRYVHYLAEKGSARIEHLQRSKDAAHAAADVDRHRNARWSPARLSRITRVRAVAGRFRRETLLRHAQWN